MLCVLRGDVALGLEVDADRAAECRPEHGRHCCCIKRLARTLTGIQYWFVAGWILAVALVVALMVACGGSQERTPERTPVKIQRPNPAVIGSGKLVEIGGGRRLFLHCVGAGTPTVVLEAGLGGNSDTWRDVRPQLGHVTRTCAYDRAGLGSSLAFRASTTPPTRSRTFSGCLTAR